MAFLLYTTLVETHIDFATNLTSCVTTAVKNAIAEDHTPGYVYWSSEPNISRAKLNGYFSEEIVTSTYSEGVDTTTII